MLNNPMNFENDQFYVEWVDSKKYSKSDSALSNNICNIYRNERHYSILLLLHICTTTMCLCVLDSCIFRTERYDGKALGSNVSPLRRLQVQVRVRCFFPDSIFFLYPTEYDKAFFRHELTVQWRCC